MAKFKIELDADEDGSWSVDVYDLDADNPHRMYYAENIIGLDVVLTIAGDAISREIYPPPGPETVEHEMSDAEVDALPENGDALSRSARSAHATV